MRLELQVCWILESLTLPLIWERESPFLQNQITKALRVNCRSAPCREDPPLCLCLTFPLGPSHLFLATPMLLSTKDSGWNLKKNRELKNNSLYEKQQISQACLELYSFSILADIVPHALADTPTEQRSIKRQGSRTQLHLNEAGFMVQQRSWVLGLGIPGL